LFVGTLGYYPNEDACRYLRSEIVPRLPDFEFQIVGTGATDRLRRLLSHPAIRIVGEVPQVDAWYHSAGAALVPVRAGGGTRIKILEAFSFRRPVITTTAGMEGIDARHDESVLVADTPEEFAKACRRLRNEPGLGERLAGNAFSLVGRFYSAEATKRTIAAFRWSPNR
jgi:glycosyltransferase involved in cell wall biosynthesis